MSIPPSPRADYEHFYLCIQAAVAGLGVAIASYLMVQDEITSRQLVAPLGFQRDGSAYYLLSSADIASEPKYARFADWVLREMERSSLIRAQAPS